MPSASRLRIRVATRPARRRTAAGAAPAQLRGGVSLPPNRLQREVVPVHRQVVLQLVERQACPASAPQVGHLELARAPDALDVLDVRVDEPPNSLILDEVLDAGEYVVVLANPDDRSRVLRRLRLLRLRLYFPAAHAVH